MGFFSFVKEAGEKLFGHGEAKAADEEARLTRAAQDLAASLRALPDATTLDVLRGLEGEAARTYFEALNLLVRVDLRDAFSMDGRSRRPPRDRMNALLSFLYSMWMNDCRSACEAAGLMRRWVFCTPCARAAPRSRST